MAIKVSKNPYRVKVKIEQKNPPQLKVDTLLLVDNKDDKLQYNDDDFIQTQVTNFLLFLRHSQQIPLRRTPLFRPQVLFLTSQFHLPLLHIGVL